MNEKKIGVFLSNLRKEKGMTQEELATKVYVDRGTISKWERGIYLPKPDLLLRLSEVFNISVNEILLGERKTMENKQEIDYVTIDIMKRSNRKIKNTIILGSIFTFLLILLFGTIFFGAYFLKHYDSIGVYHITGKNDNFELYDSMLFISGEEVSLLVSGIKNYSDEKIYSIDIYYKKEDECKRITSTTGFIQHLGGRDLVSDLEFLTSDLYMDVTYGKNRKETIVDTVKLVISKEYSNSTL